MKPPLSMLRLTAESFRPYGEVISAAAAASRFEINDGNATRHYDLARLDCVPPASAPVLSFFDVRPHAPEFDIRILERHPLASQAFLPLATADWLVIVAEGDAASGPLRPRVFRPAPGDGVNLGRGVWHAPLACRQAARFLVLDGGVSEENLEIVRFEPPRWRVSFQG